MSPALHLLATQAGLSAAPYTPAERHLATALLTTHSTVWDLTLPGTARTAAPDVALPTARARGDGGAATAHAAAPDGALPGAAQTAAPDIAHTAALDVALLVAGDGRGRWDLVIEADTAAHFLAVGPDLLVLYDAADVTRRPQRTIAGEEFWSVDTGDTPGRILCADPDRVALATAWARCLTAGYLWGLAQGSLEAAVRRLTERHQFGRPIGDNQAPAFTVAALAARLQAYRRLGETVAARLGEPAAGETAVERAGETSARQSGAAVAEEAVAGAADAGRAGSVAEPVRYASWLLAACADLAMDTTTESLHLHGASGLLSGSPAQRYYRKAHTHAVRHGTPTRLRLTPTGRSDTP